MAFGDTMTPWVVCMLCKHEDLNEGLVNVKLCCRNIYSNLWSVLLTGGCWEPVQADRLGQSVSFISRETLFKQLGGK